MRKHFKQHFYKYVGKQGFSLIELMIVVALIAILATVATSQYRTYIVKSNRAVGLMVLQSNLLAIEQFRTSNLVYPTSVQVSTNQIAGYLTQSTQASPYYRYVYTLNAGVATVNMLTNNNAVGAPLDQNCQNLALNSNNQRFTNNNLINTTDNCWNNKAP